MSRRGTKCYFYSLLRSHVPSISDGLYMYKFQGSRPFAKGCPGFVLIDLVDRHRHVDLIHDMPVEGAARGNDFRSACLHQGSGHLSLPHDAKRMAIWRRNMQMHAWEANLK